MECNDQEKRRLKLTVVHPCEKERQMRDRNNHRPIGRNEGRTKHASYTVGNPPMEIVRSNASIHPATDPSNPCQEKKREGTEDKDAWKATPCNAPIPQGKKTKAQSCTSTQEPPFFIVRPRAFLAIQSPTLQVLLQILTRYLFQKTYDLFGGVLHLAVAVFQQLSQKGKSLW